MKYFLALITLMSIGSSVYAQASDLGLSGLKVGMSPTDATAQLHASGFTTKAMLIRGRHQVSTYLTDPSTNNQIFVIAGFAPNTNALDSIAFSVSDELDATRNANSNLLRQYRAWTHQMYQKYGRATTTGRDSKNQETYCHDADTEVSLEQTIEGKEVDVVLSYFYFKGVCEGLGPSRAVGVPIAYAFGATPAQTRAGENTAAGATTYSAVQTASDPEEKRPLSGVLTLLPQEPLIDESRVQKYYRNVETIQPPNGLTAFDGAIRVPPSKNKRLVSSSEDGVKDASQDTRRATFTYRFNSSPHSGQLFTVSCLYVIYAFDGAAASRDAITKFFADRDAAPMVSWDELGIRSDNLFAPAAKSMGRLPTEWKRENIITPKFWRDVDGAKSLAVFAITHPREQLQFVNAVQITIADTRSGPLVINRGCTQPRGAPPQLIELAVREVNLLVEQAVRSYR